MNKKIKLFQNQNIHTHWGDTQEKWFFSVVDVVVVLTEQKNHKGARNYWKVLKHRVLKESDQLIKICNQLKMLASDGKMHLTDEITKAWSDKATEEYKKPMVNSKTANQLISKNDTL
jgi:hypothetical protein